MSGKKILARAELFVFVVMLNCTTSVLAQHHEISVNPAKLPLFFAKSEHFMIDLNYCKMFDEEWGMRLKQIPNA